MERKFSYPIPLAPWKKSYDQPRQHVKKETLLCQQGSSNQSYGFLVVMYGCDSWTTKKAECPRINTFELWCWNRLLRVPWAARRSNQSILKEISCEYSLERLMRKLKLRYFGYLMWRTYSLGRPWCWERLKSGGKGDDRGWDGWKASLTWWTWVWASSSSWWWTGKHAAAYEVAKSRTRMMTELNWTDTF